MRKKMNGKIAIPVIFVFLSSFWHTIIIRIKLVEQIYKF
ncbi:hypothetical protein AB406_1630 [Riemerella anatipestifer]|uniref:Uncharacterized protein n=1 Tax=Riemerella anatipestifer TaxID=34085 RepID=A0A1S7DTZ2_RIEAN|nr:hypothetical protein AB406_1630 [Riemerella anatipestifer]